MTKRFFRVDYLSFIYFFIVGSLIFIFREKVRFWQYYLLAYFFYLSFILILSFLNFKYPENNLIKFLKFFYPIITFTFVYKSIEGYVLILHNNFLDKFILIIEEKIFGKNPVFFLEEIVSKGLTEFLKFSYFSYYLYVPVPALILFFKKRFKELEHFVFWITITFYFCYICFVLFPIQGPWYELKEFFRIKELDGYIFTKIQDFIMANGAVRGACMPSSHLAVAWLSLLMIRKFFGNKIFFVILPFTISMSVSIVYNRYHYFSDAIAGIIVGFIFYRISEIENKKVESKF
jgi:membrane-associated phospholipid phosphatase